METKPYPHPALPGILAGLKELEKDEGLIAEATRAYYREGWDGWPPAVALPIGIAIDLTKSYRLQPVEHMLMASLLSVYTAWRLTKGAYLFDPVVWAELKHTPVGKIPVGLLERLPEKTPLLLFPEPLDFLEIKIDAAHVYLDYDPRPPDHLELRFLMWGISGTDRRPINLILDLDGGDLEECLEKTARRSSPPKEFADQYDQVIQAEKRLLPSLISAALFLCQETPDLEREPRQPPARPLSPRGYRRIKTPEKTHVIPTGWRWGAAIQRAKAAQAEGRPTEGPGNGRSIAPHVRRAHWHLYWTGQGIKKDPSKAQASLRWVSATLVGAREQEALEAVTVRKIVGRGQAEEKKEPPIEKDCL